MKNIFRIISKFFATRKNYDRAFILLQNSCIVNAKPMLFVNPGFSTINAAAKTLSLIKNRKIYCYQQVNHFDQSRYFQQATFDLMIQDLKNVVDYIGLDKFTLMGHCMGGRLATQFACKYPQKIECLIINQTVIGQLKYPSFEQILNKFLQLSNSKKSDYIKLLEKHFNKNQEQNVDFPNKLVKLMINKFKYFDSDDRLQWKINLHTLVKNYFSIWKYMELTNKFYGRTLITIGGRSLLALNCQNFKIKFPNIDIQKDVVMFKENTHTSIILEQKARKEYSQFIENYLSLLDSNN